MAYEARILFETEFATPWTCADGTAIDKGSLLKLADPSTVSISAHGSADDTFGGIITRDKIANDGAQASVLRGCRAKIRLSGNCTVGDALVLDSDVNTVKAALSNNPAGDIVGLSCETGTTGEYIEVDVRPGVAQPFI